ncbi:MAG: hypothetical protein RMM08_07640 [Armatimonadota bacterium]|nr:hypothetical protein [bacterium]MDW8321219.1 hypothetical protein [Armatimonadota bacterium]
MLPVTRTRWLGGALVIAVLSLLSACGGMFQSEKRGLPPTEQTRSRVQQTLATGWNAASLGGASFAEAMVARSGGRAKGILLVGSFARTFSEENGDKPGEPLPHFYYDEWLGVWVQVEENGSGARMLLYEDEERTKPAGVIESTYPENPDTYPQTYRYRYEILAGWRAGSRGEHVVTVHSETASSMQYEYQEGDGSQGRGSSRWDERGGEWSNRYESADGFWSEDSGVFSVDGSGRTQSANSLGYRSRFEYRPDGSGEGVIEGPDPGLPATITWTADGRMTIRWADGTVEEFNLWEVWTGDGEGETEPGGSG